MSDSNVMNFHVEIHRTLGIQVIKPKHVFACSQERLTVALVRREELCHGLLVPPKLDDA